jgi:hypothetical protein
LVRGRTSCAGEEKNKREGLYEKVLLWHKKEVRNKIICPLAIPYEL